MISLKSAKEIEIMRDGGKKLALVMEKVLAKVKPGMKLKEVDNLAEKLIEEQGGKPSFKMVKGYHWATCLNVNQGVVHGIPTDYHLKDNDILSVDIGMYYQGLHTDMARTIRVKEKRTKDIFLKAGEKALKRAILVAKAGNRVGHISLAIQTEIEKYGFSPVQTLVGHGVGKELHEAPTIPCYLKGKVKETSRLKPGMTLAVEVIYTQGDPDILVKKDGWTTETVDGSLACLFEDTVIVTSKGPLVLTKT